MPSMDAPTWWADVQQDRDNLTAAGRRRPADDWLQEDIDFAPRRRLKPGTSQTIVLDPVDPMDHDVVDHDAGAGHPMHGVFISAGPAPSSARPRTVQVTGPPGELPRASRARRPRPQSAWHGLASSPDRIALWAVILGAVLIILAAMSSSSHAAEVVQASILR